jgi:hypothetical protein
MNGCNQLVILLFVAGGLALMCRISSITTPSGVDLCMMIENCLKNFVLKDFKQVCRG